MNRLLYIGALFLAMSSHAQSINIGITIGTYHFKRVSKHTGKKYNEFNPGITIGYRASNGATIETGFVKNSHKKLTWVTAVGYRHGDWEVQIGGATGYKSVGQPWLRPGYFINYYGDPIKLKLNHEIINFGATKEFNLKNELL